ncbi:MAG: 16S rRNA (cytosine(1402)-N(4))-methyltransferase [Elusimicrobia bacterium RIFCSPLOWO2_01_FULL_54_10]|nr:MAG: 16S rRNA (cytosine(1402)-N(4))-methyltransferase [Elusimicrobia bacterium RIFCSPLOWO2_01_FULL_54_10]
MNDYEHKTVLPGETIELWHAKPGGVYVDATLGLGGHSEALLALDPQATVLGLDVDDEALQVSRSRLARFGPRILPVKESYMNLSQALHAAHFKEADGVLADLGVSSLQLDKAERGFSFRNSGPLDMRMDSAQEQTALELIQQSSDEELEQILRTYGEERLARSIARRLKEASRDGRLTDTLSCAAVVASVYGKRGGREKIHPATRTFQALRIAVNREMANLDKFLVDAPRLLAQGGRLVCLSFHSLEDRKVKTAFRALSQGCVCPADFPKCVCGKTAEFKMLTKKPVVAADVETARNPRSRSARLRALERI